MTAINWWYTQVQNNPRMKVPPVMSPNDTTMETTLVAAPATNGSASSLHLTQFGSRTSFQVDWKVTHIQTATTDAVIPSHNLCSAGLCEGKSVLSFFLSFCISFFVFVFLSSPHLFVIHSPKSESPKEACCRLICSDIIWDLTGCVSCGLWASRRCVF